MMRRNGSQVSRVRVKKVGNPRTESQAHNRALLSTLGVAYGYMRGIVDHSFQGLSKKSMNMQKFMSDNQGLARQLDGAPAFDLQNYNYNFKGETVLRPNPYVIARGTMPAVNVIYDPDDEHMLSPQIPSWNFVFEGAPTDITYKQLADALGVPVGTQLTFCAITDDTFNNDFTGGNVPKSYGNFHVARVILAPDDGDGSKKAFDYVSGSSGPVKFANVNSRNSGVVVLDDAFDTAIFYLAGKEHALAAGVIASYYEGQWLRSNCQLIVAPDYVYSNGMAEVYPSYMDAAAEQPQSDLYLNQSEQQPQTYSQLLEKDYYIPDSGTAAQVAGSSLGEFSSVGTLRMVCKSGAYVVSAAGNAVTAEMVTYEQLQAKPQNWAAVPFFTGTVNLISFTPAIAGAVVLSDGDEHRFTVSTE